MRAWGRFGRALPALVVWIAAGCETLVDGQLGAVACEDQGAVGPPACPDGLACRTGRCVPDVLGATCTTDTDCADDEFCLDPTTLNGTGPQRCTRTCCSSADCDPDPGAVCWVPPGGGGAYCRPAVELGLVPGGTRDVLSPCATDADCRSGRCVGQLCADTCCSDTQCAGNGGTCREGGPPVGTVQGFWCSPPSAVAGSPLYYPCSKNADCASGLCLDFVGAKASLCSGPCCSSDDCEDLSGVPVRCVMLTGALAGVRACLTQGAGSAEVGDACEAPTDCRGGMCLSLSGRDQCTDYCCSDASCGGGSTSVCRPAMNGSAWALRCEPK